MIGQNSKLYSTILLGLLGLSGLLYILFVLEMVSEGVMLNWCFLLLGIATLVAVVFPILGMAKDLKKAKSSLIGVGVLAVIFIVSYVMSTAEPYISGELVIDGSVTKASEAGLIMFYIMIFLAIGAILYTEISKAFK